VAFHPQCHLEGHEHKGYAVVHGLTAELVGDPWSLIQLSDLDGLIGPVAALLLELPQREIGGQLPGWEDLVAQTGWAHERGVACIWTVLGSGRRNRSTTRPHAEIAALFDNRVRVALQRTDGDLGSDAGRRVRDHRADPAVAGPARRLGGAGLAVRADRRARSGRADAEDGRVRHRSRKLARCLVNYPGCTWCRIRRRPRCFHLHLDASPAAVSAASQELASGAS